jgi:transposase
MRFVEPKTPQQQARAVLFRSRERLVNQRTELINALRAMLNEYGHVVPVGIGHVKRLEAVLNDASNDLPDLVREEGLDLMVQIAEQTTRISAKTRKMEAVSKQTDVARRLQTMPGIGPLTAVAVEAFAPTMENFRSGRDFAAWLGLVPRQYSSGGKAKLGKVSKAGQTDIRRLLIIGAMARVNWACRKETSSDPWIMRMLGRKPRTLTAIALANRMARMIWAMLTKQEDYRNPAPAIAA